jgi:ABC-type lipoprotein release transport system permease subunit
MTWQFYEGTIDPEKKSAERVILFTALEPRKVPTLMDRMFDDAPQESRQRQRKLALNPEFLAAIDIMKKNKRAVILGVKILEKLNKRVGERIKVTGTNYNGIDLEFDIVGAFPEGRYNQTAIMNRDYLNDAIDLYPRAHAGQKHVLADRRLNYVVLEVRDLPSANRVEEQIQSSGLFQTPAVKSQTLSAFLMTEFDSFGDIVWAMRWLFSPAALITLALVVANGISITVRERRAEIAVLKVLGYRPVHILLLFLSESMLIGALSGILSAAFVYEAVNQLLDNSDLLVPIYIPEVALCWGPVVGALTGLAGSLIPALTACRIQVSTVFARVT